MSLFGHDEPVLDDPALLRAVRKRLMREIEAQHSGQSQAITNNVYGGGSGGLTEQMHGAHQEDPNMFDYLVNIERRDLPEKDPVTGKPVGWEKKVRRYREPKGEMGKK